LSDLLFDAERCLHSHLGLYLCDLSGLLRVLSGGGGGPYHDPCDEISGGLLARLARVTDNHLNIAHLRYPSPCLLWKSNTWHACWIQLAAELEGEIGGFAARPVDTHIQRAMSRQGEPGVRGGDKRGGAEGRNVKIPL